MGTQLPITIATKMDRFAGRTWGLAVSPDARHLASASWDNTIKVWDLATGQEISMMALDVRAASASFISDIQSVIGDRLGSAARVRLESGEG